MSTASARRVASTAIAAVALLLVPAAAATAVPPQCVTPPPQTTVTNFTLELNGIDYCTDPDTTPLAFAVTQPANGNTIAFDAFLLYVPATDYTGPDEFTFTASDGTTTTAPVTVTITVFANEPPDCPPDLSFVVEPGVPTWLHPEDECDDDGAITDFDVTNPPDRGTLAPFDDFMGLVYTPAAGYSGPDAFTIVAEDHDGEMSGPIDVSMTVLEPNRAPVCVTPVTVRLPTGGRTTLDHRRTCSDPDGDPIISPTLGTPPAHGHFELGMSGLFDFVADPGYAGGDRFTYRVMDTRGGVSNDAVVELVIGDPPAPPPLTQAQVADLAGPALGLARAGAQKLAAVRRHGLKLRVGSDEAGTATIELTVARKTARRLGTDRRVGHATKALVAGDNEVTVKLTRKARRRLAEARRVTILVLVSARDGAGNASRDTLQLTLRR